MKSLRIKSFFGEELSVGDIVFCMPTMKLIIKDYINTALDGIMYKEK